MLGYTSIGSNSLPGALPTHPSMVNLNWKEQLESTGFMDLNADAYAYVTVQYSMSMLLINMGSQDIRNYGFQPP